MILLVGGEKGGTGKSAIACNLAVALAIKNRDVMLVDADPQGTASKWVNRRNKKHSELPKINCVQKTGDVFDTVRDLAGRYDELIIDAGGRDSEELRTALVTSHKLLTPLKPAQDNIETMSRMVSLVKQAKAINRNLEAYVIINMASSHHLVNTAFEASELLQVQQNAFSVLSKNTINDYKIFQDANADGISVVETQHKKAKTQIQSLCNLLYADILTKKEEIVYG